MVSWFGKFGYCSLIDLSVESQIQYLDWCTVTWYCSNAIYTVHVTSHVKHKQSVDSATEPDVFHWFLWICGLLQRNVVKEEFVLFEHSSVLMWHPESNNGSALNRVSVLIQGMLLKTKTTAWCGHSKMESSKS